MRGTGVATTISHIENRLRQIRVDLADFERQRDEVNERLKGHDEAEIARNRRDYDKLTGEIRIREDRIRLKEESIRKNQSEVARLRAEIRKASGPQLARLNREAQVYEELIALFQKAVAEMRDNLRKTVEWDAS